MYRNDDLFGTLSKQNLNMNQNIFLQSFHNCDGDWYDQNESYEDNQNESHSIRTKMKINFGVELNFGTGWSLYVHVSHNWGRSCSVTILAPRVLMKWQSWFKIRKL